MVIQLDDKILLDPVSISSVKQKYFVITKLLRKKSPTLIYLL